MNRWLDGVLYGLMDGHFITIIHAELSLVIDFLTHQQHIKMLLLSVVN